MNDPNADHTSHGIATLSLTEETPDGGLVYQSWKVCACLLPPLRVTLGEPFHEAMANREQVEATGRAVLGTDSGTHLGEGM
ncbi:hypothetical protein ACFQ08_15640 [Streptosporangium algeriense]|uniref:Uncharacterized protein n=1 Tax=Streptosporangium algeriense TaxID=1682748 RepID=A0ABW3DQ41_9ACTN